MLNKKRVLSVSFENQLTDLISSLPSLMKSSHESEDEEEQFSWPDMMDSCEGLTVELRLPPPQPFFDRRSSLSSVLHLDGVLSRGRSHSPDQAASGRREVLRSVNMTQSMPSQLSSRTLHNRCVGFSLSSSMECRGVQGKNLRQARVQEFEQLLDEL
jgi:hypothetical protein